MENSKKNPVELIKTVKWNWFNSINQVIFTLNENTHADRQRWNLTNSLCIYTSRQSRLPPQALTFEKPSPHRGHFSAVSGALLLYVFPFPACRHFLAGLISFLLLYETQNQTSPSVGLRQHQNEQGLWLVCLKVRAKVGGSTPSKPHCKGNRHQFSGRWGCLKQICCCRSDAEFSISSYLEYLAQWLWK